MSHISPMLRMPLLCLALCLAGVANARTPKLSPARPLVCRVNAPATEWLPSHRDIAALERALPGYFASQERVGQNMPAPDVEYARQYSGIVQNGKKYITGRFHPPLDAPPSFARDGLCWHSEDGGARHWSVVFDRKSGRIIRHSVNGIG